MGKVSLKSLPVSLELETGTATKTAFDSMVSGKKSFDDKWFELKLNETTGSVKENRESAKLTSELGNRV